MRRVVRERNGLRAHVVRIRFVKIDGSADSGTSVFQIIW